MPNDIVKLRRIMRQANMLTNQSPANGNRSYALRVAHTIEDFRNKLREGFVRFSYVKADGSHRVALGTLSPALIPADKMPKGDMSDGAAIQENKDRIALVTYFDLDKNAWRSFYFYSLVEDETSDRAWKIDTSAA